MILPLFIANQKLTMRAYAPLGPAQLLVLAPNTPVVLLRTHPLWTLRFIALDLSSLKQFVVWENYFRDSEYFRKAAV